MADLDPLSEVQECWETANRAFADAHRLMDRERRFSEGEHYLDDDPDIDLARIRPKTEALVRVLNFKTGKVTGGPLYFETRPADPDPDPNDPDDVQLGEYGTRLVESNIANPCNRYNATRYRMAWAGFSHRMGIAELSFAREVGLWGECLWNIVPFDSVMWEPSFLDMHDPRCPWVVHAASVPLSQIVTMKGWKNTGDVKEDGGIAPYSQSRADRPIGQNSGYDPIDKRQPKSATILKLWKRQNSVTREKSYEALPEESRTMVCGSTNPDGTVNMGCGYQTDTQANTGESYPEISSMGMNPITGRMEGGCPTCGGNMTRIDGYARGEMVSSYGRGRLLIVAPNSNVVLYDNKWPWRLRSFPYWVFRPALRDSTAFGPSETTNKWSLQALDDASLRMGYEQMQRSRDVTFMPRTGIEDASGNTYDFLSSMGPAFYTKEINPGAVWHFQGSGLNQAMVAWRGMIRGAFREDEGTTDFSPNVSGEGAKDIPVGTIDQYVESGNVPLDAIKSIWREDESLALGLLLDMQLETYTDDRAREMWGADGPQMLALLKQRAAHIQVLDQPSLAKLSSDKMQALAAYDSIQNPGLRKVAARRMGLSASDVREIDGGRDAMMQPPMSAPPGGVPAGAPEQALAPTAVGTGGI